MEQNPENNLVSDTYSENFLGRTADGLEIKKRTITNNNGFEVTLLDFGATIQSLKVPVGDKTIDVVLGFDTLSEYEISFRQEGTPFHGAVVGPHAGRIKNGKILIGEKEIQLEKNLNDKHHIHGGSINFSNMVWKPIDIEKGRHQPRILYYLETPEGLNGYPGKIKAFAEYSLLENNALKITLSAETTEDTPVNLTQHSYFNLDGQNGDVQQQELKINSTQYLDTDSDLIPTGNILPIEQSEYEKYINFFPCPKNIDTSFITQNSLAASLQSLKNRLRMNVYTNQPSVHIYVGGKLQENMKGKGNAKYHQQSGICFETQNFPDAPNHKNFKTSVLKAGQKYSYETIYQFETI